LFDTLAENSGCSMTAGIIILLFLKAAKKIYKINRE